MKAVLSSLAGSTGFAFAVLGILILLCWFGGELMGASNELRALIIVILLVIGLVAFIVQKVMVARGAAMIENQMQTQGQEQVQSARPDKRPEVQAVQQQLNEAIQALKNSRLGKGALYALPWYMIIGPPGSGKSTAIQESGLNFPHTSQGGKGIRGVGGTRNCDWWFTDEGILLDTAGRYTTEIDDRDEWLAFLDMVRKSRKHKPINGAMVAVSIPDLLGATEEELEQHAKKIRDRIDELTKQLDLVFPVYLLFTKCDMFHGFVEFFEDFTKADRSQVWGCTLPYAPPGNKSYREVFDEESKKLFQSLSRQRLAALANERPAAKKQAIYLFPVQFSMALKRLGNFVEALFRPNPFQETSIFRGFYFTSGTQEGTPIDQVIRSMSEAFGLQEDAGAPAPQAADKKSYFLNHLFTKIIFPDQRLARTSSRIAKRKKIVSLATLGGSALATAVLLVGMIVSFFGNMGLIGAAEEAALDLREKQAASESDLPGTLAALDGLREEVEELDLHRRGSRPLGKRWGLYRGDEVEKAAGAVYFAALEKMFLRPVSKELKKKIQALWAQERKSYDEFKQLYAFHRVYQVLGGGIAAESERDRKVVTDVLSMENFWVTGLGSGLDEKSRSVASEQLRFFLTQLDRGPEWKTEVDGKLRDEVGNFLSRSGLWILEAYRSVVEDGARGYPKVDGNRFLQDGGRGVLTFESTFSELFTRKGWDEFVQAQIGERSTELAGQYQAMGREDMTADVIKEQLVRKFRDEYSRKWSDYLKGVQVVPSEDLEVAGKRLMQLAEEGTSPYGKLIEGVWAAREIQFSPEVSLAKPGTLEWLPGARAALKTLAEVIQSFTITAPKGKRVIPALEGGRLQAFLGAFAQAQADLDKKIQGLDQEQRDVARGLFTRAVENALGALSAEAQGEADLVWASEVHEQYAAELQGKFPFDEGAADPASMAAFSRLFNNASGTFWKTFATVDKLHALNVNGKPMIQYSAEFRAAMKKAEAFRDLMFTKTSEEVSVPFWVTLRQRKGVTGIRFSIGTQQLDYYDLPNHRKKLAWNEGEAGGAKLSIRVGGADGWSDKEEKDAWGVLRLLKSGNPKKEGENRFVCLWEYKIRRLGTEEVFLGELVVETEDLPRAVFTTKFYSEFVCPGKVGP